MNKTEKERIAEEEQKDASPVIIQLGIFAAVLFVSNILSVIMPKAFPVPVPVWGLIILYVLLTTHVVKLHQVEKLSGFLIGIIGVFFVPSGIQMYKSLDLIKEDGITLIIAIIASTIILLITVTFTARLFISISKKIRNRRA
ncbi:CidA/LrgA family protein [Companilactobacillus keshanensis]|uniref:CidA/LrgA family protein n=1 Tax=Companilactobacillus keshanensis TaxID=2486003 RepID=A0ABW4BW28_9LACO|nr:CidA/LrgA family protein [Companilactobacillus keshanensis]